MVSRIDQDQEMMALAEQEEMDRIKQSRLLAALMSELGGGRRQTGGHSIGQGAMNVGDQAVPELGDHLAGIEEESARTGDAQSAAMNAFGDKIDMGLRMYAKNPKLFDKGIGRFFGDDAPATNYPDLEDGGGLAEAVKVTDGLSDAPSGFSGVAGPSAAVGIPLAAALLKSKKKKGGLGDAFFDLF